LRSASRRARAPVARAHRQRAPRDGGAGGVHGELLTSAHLVRGSQVSVRVPGRDPDRGAGRQGRGIRCRPARARARRLPGGDGRLDGDARPGRFLVGLSLDASGELAAAPGHVFETLRPAEGGPPHLRTDVARPAGSALFNSRAELVALHVGPRLATVPIDELRARLARGPRERESPLTPDAPIVRPMGKAAFREVVVLWAIAFAAIAVTRAIPPVSQYAKAVAAVAFMFLPGRVVWPRGEDTATTAPRWSGGGAPSASGWRSRWRCCRSSSWLLAFIELLQNLPASCRGSSAPYPKGASFAFRLPDRFGAHVVDQLLWWRCPRSSSIAVHAIRPARRLAQGRVVWGARLGRASG